MNQLILNPTRDWVDAEEDRQEELYLQSELDEVSGSVLDDETDDAIYGPALCDHLGNFDDETEYEGEEQ